MSLQCTECQGNIADSKAGDKLAFCVDGTSVHLVMGASNEGRPGIGFRVEPVSADKRPTEKNPYRSVSHVLCANTRQDNGQVCRKKVGGVKCYPPLSDNQLIFFSHKALLVDHHRHKSWKDAREGTLRKVLLLPAGKEEEERQFQPRQWPPLVKTVRHDDQDAAVAAVTATAGMMRTPPRAYQEELFSAVMECEQNSLVYLPTGLGKTLVASMVLRRLLDLNPDRQAFFLVETTALAMQQTTRLQYEVGGMVEMLVGSSLAMYGSSGTRDGVDRGKEKLERLRAASIVVATAGAFEHCMCKHYIDPDSISCVVLDEAHHCGKEHPFNRVARSFLTMKAFPNVSPTRERDRELPKLVALTASPAGELTVFDTTVRINELLERLEAKLVAPVKHLGEVKRLTPTVNLELVNVTATSAETALLACLEKLVLSRVARIAPKASEVHAQARSLLDSLHSRTRDAYAAAEATAASGVDVPRKDDSWRFPNKFFTALCQRALALRNYAGGGGGGAEQSGYLDWEADGAGMTMGDKEGDPLQLYKLMNASFAVDEVGGRPTWEKVLEELEKGKRGRGQLSSGGGRNGAGGGVDDPELEETIRVLRSHLPAGGAAPDGRSGAAAAVAAEGGDGVGGSKLAKMVSLLEEHKRSCDESEKRFSALVFVSRRDLAQVTPAMLEAAAPFVRAQCVVGLAEMTLNQQRVALGSFRDGVKNVLVSTSVCGEGIDVPACALVVCASLPNSGTELVQLRGRIRSKEKGCRFVGLTRTSGAADQTHLKSICLREQNMLEAIRCLSSGDTSLARAGDGKITGDDMTRAGNSRATTAATKGILEPPIGSSAASRESAGTPTVAWSGCAAAGGGNGKSKSKSRSRSSNNTPLSPKSDVTAETYNISESSSFTASSTVSSFGGHAARTLEKPATPGAAETTPTSPGYVANVQGSKAVDPPSGFQGSSKATQLLPSPRPIGVEGGGKGSSAPVQVSLATGLAVTKVKSGKVDGVAFAPKTAAGDGQEGEEEEEEEERNPWNKALPKMLTSAARRYAATYLATCVRQALQRNPDQMARCTLNSAAQLAQTIKPVFEYDERRVPGPPNASLFEARCIVRSNLAELEGLILVKEARGSSIKAAREGAAVKVKIYLLSKENSKVQPLGSCP
ncbi:unnamed protein product [Scytosiphon promiscuus]